jgi:hypothetical protein
MKSSRLLVFALALALGVALKFAVHEGEQTSVQTISNVSVQTTIPGGFLVLNPVTEAQIQLRGKISDMSELNPLNVRIVANVQAEAPGVVEIPLGPTNVQNINGLEVLTINPNVLVLEVDREITKVLQVRAEVVGEPAAGARIGRPIGRPDNVEVVGPESLLRNLSELTVSVSVERRAISFEERVTPTMPQSVRLARPTPIIVAVEMQVPEVSIDDRTNASLSLDGDNERRVPIG